MMYFTENDDLYLHKQSKNEKKAVILLLSFVFFVSAAASSTVSYLRDQTTTVMNKVSPSFVDCEVQEAFDGITKSNVNVRNTGDIDAYIRVKLVTYRVNEEGRHIGGTASIPSFVAGENWVEHNGYYYYTKPVGPQELPETNLISQMGLTSYSDVDGGRQVIEVMAEAIQAYGKDAAGKTPVQLAWKVTLGEGSVASYSEG